MNLIDGHVTKVIEKKKFTAPDDWGSSAGKVFDIFVVEYWDDGGTNQKELWFDAEENKDVQPGYVFQH